ncbi:hypothetical protein SDC9_76170 [bioreactor metagenome]|uniref:Uncharacterized protein n=1 Tax=bioreactor metagenome TaxID=1076179 RepID=A0A644YMH5_9ZZZZ
MATALFPRDSDGTRTRGPGHGDSPPGGPDGLSRRARIVTDPDDRSVVDRTTGTRTGERADLHLDGLVLVVFVRGDRAEPAEDEADRDRDQGRVVQREPGEVGVREHRVLGARDRRGEDDQHHRRDQAAVDAPQRTAGVEPLPVERVEDRRQVRRGGEREGQRHQEGDVLPVRDDTTDDRDQADDDRGDPGDAQLLAGLRRALLDHRVVDVMGERRRRGDGQAGDDREDRRERHTGDQRHQDGAAQLVRQGRSGRIGAARHRLDLLRADQPGGAEAEDHGEQVEQADQADGPGHRAARLLGGRHGVEAHQHVRQAGRPEHQGDRERDEAQLVRAVLAHRLQQMVAGARLDRVDVVDRLLDQRRQVEPDPRHHPHRHHDHTDDQQDRLDHLHPGGALHATDQDVGHHQQSDDHDDDVLAGLARDAEEQGHQAAGPGHLGEQVEEGDEQGRDGCGHPDRTVLDPEGDDVGHRVAAGVAQRLGDEQQGDQPGDEEAHGVEQAVVAVEGDRPYDAEEGGGGQVVAGDGEAVLAPGEGGTAGVEVTGLLHPAAGHHDHHGHGDDDEADEDADVDGRIAQRGEREHQWAPSWSDSRSVFSCADSGSRDRFACRMYSHVMRNVVTNWRKEISRPMVMLPAIRVLIQPTAYTDSRT